jgi:DNA replication protein DnaC
VVLTGWLPTTERKDTMLAHPTHDQLRALGLHGMAKAFGDLAANPEADTLGHGDWLALLLDRETVHRQDKRLGSRLLQARLRHQAAPEDINYRAQRGLDRALLKGLIEGDWIGAGDNLVITGPTGVGKSWLACALGHKACRDNRSVLYVRAPKLFLDDWGLEPLTAQARHDLLEILEDRYGRKSTLVTSQVPVADWHGLIGHATYADAILDRLVYNAHRIDLTGESMRRKKPNQKA